MDLCFAEAYYQGTALSEVIIRLKNVCLYICRGCVSKLLRGCTISINNFKKHTQGWSNSCLMNVTSLNMLK